MIRKLSILGLVSAVIPATVSAATLVEGVDYADAPIADLGVLGAGAHSVSGLLSGTCLIVGGAPDCGLGSDPQDTVSVPILPGTQVTSVGFSLASLQDAPSVFRSEFSYSSPTDAFTFSGLQDGTYGPDAVTPTSGAVVISFAGVTGEAPGKQRL